MKNYVGIDLGTTNSAISTYNGDNTIIWKSPEQNDVTPSAIYFDRRGNKYVGKRAYDSAASHPENSAVLFKRVMGTNTPIKFPALDKVMTPEECSAEILKVLFGYLPEEIRKDADTGIVITVPAAFNQMQKDATMQAASMAGLGKVALMQEPVAAVMSVMRVRKTDGMFLIFDLGGGTLDVAIAESIRGQVSLLSHGGIAMCGGRDFDRTIVNNIIRPWLTDNFLLPEGFITIPKYKKLGRLIAWAAERAKIELSAKESCTIILAEDEARTVDENGEEIYLEIPLTRNDYDRLIADRINEAVIATRETLDHAGLSPEDVENIVFIGGPTNYKPLRDKVCYELGIKGGVEVNPMTAVSEGAALFAESIDWETESRARKSSRGQITAKEFAISFAFMARTPRDSTKVAVKLGKQTYDGYEFQIDSIDTGWTSGHLVLERRAVVEVLLSQSGVNTFRVTIFDEYGHPVSFENSCIKITKTAATIEAIPSSHSIGVEVLDRLGGQPVLDYLIRAGDPLPKKGRKTFKAAMNLQAGSADSLNIKVWEGEITNPISDNRSIGVLKVSGADFDEGTIPAGADLICDYEILDSGNVVLEVSVPSIASTFASGKNFYSRQEGQIDFSTQIDVVKSEANSTMERLNSLSEDVEDRELDIARAKLEKARNLPNNAEAEEAQEAMENIYEARKLLSRVSQANRGVVREKELQSLYPVIESMKSDNLIKEDDLSEIIKLLENARNVIDRNDGDYEKFISSARTKMFRALFKVDAFVIAEFNTLCQDEGMYSNRAEFLRLKGLGEACIERGDINQVRKIIFELFSMRHDNGNAVMSNITNIIRS